MSATAPFIRAIETNYHECFFRSRLEARWAVFFDQMQYRWRYEEEGFELPSGRYLPDFKLDGTFKPLFVEIKGQKATESERQKCFELADGSGVDVLLLSGNIGFRINLDTPFEFEFESELFSGYRTIKRSWTRDDEHFGLQLPWHLAQNGFANRLTVHPYKLLGTNEDHQQYVRHIIELDREFYLAKYGKTHPFWVHGVTSEAFFDGPRDPHLSMKYIHGCYGRRDEDVVLDALEYARSARFEFGETP